MVEGSVRSAGMTFYTKQGRTVVRTSKSSQPRRNSRAQFIGRQRMKHCVSLWHELYGCNPTFAGGRSPYTRFMSLSAQLPAVFLPQDGKLGEATLLLPGTPVSEGSLPAVGAKLGEAGGNPALVTSLRPGTLGRDERLWLYTFRQTVERQTPKVRITKEELPKKALVTVDGALAMVDDRFADDDCGWAIVRTLDDNCSTESVVTRCTLYQSFTTEEALQAAAASYGGLTGEDAGRRG